MTTILLDHIHFRSRHPEAVADFLSRHFDVEIVERMEVRGLPRVVLRIGDVAIFVEGATDDMPRVPGMPFRGIEHVCVRVSDIAAHAARLEQAGVTLLSPVSQIRPGVQIAFVEAPDGILIEMIERLTA
ncbi:VOC family protein (plasmid) [Lichenicola cladoniae]|uniref:VOC family protein n=1 Tax=Lichenicola cladoniae TaxID=1484109 RepID=A0A6M8HY12_9PROT|nr:VOC family protein [Lichenicola cladoniae]NPD68697.1 VOC family protein [Acetobacteraceae bacterium]QKE93077.1 VOC family protein [Lichenicola cladoniae]